MKTLSISVVLVAASALAATAQTVTVDTGALRGATDGGVTAFLGVPFAAPPVGDLRWRAPQPAEAWSGERDATQYGPDCQQTPFPSDAAPLGTEPAEDCLYLNVWTPEDAGPADGLPVMFWIHGGGFVNGGASPAVYAGDEFARDGVVLVSANHRLGRFGFFAHPALTADAGERIGNFAVLDQIAALEWVQRNIERFGGDPHDVTIFGESAGGFAVHFLMTTPRAEGLFDKAVIQSGGGRAHGMPAFAEAEAQGLEIAASLGVEGADAAALAALRAIDAKTLEGGLNIATMGRVANIGPMLDDLIPMEAVEVYEAGGGARVPLLVGANDADSFFFGGDIDAAYAQLPGGRTPQAEALYDPEGSGDALAVGTRISSDLQMNEPARHVARLLAPRQPVYLYRFSYVAESARAQSPNGAAHAAEIPFVFDTVDAKYGDALTEADARVAGQAQAYWVAFAKTGQMAPNGLPALAPYDPAQANIVEFTEAGPVVGPDPLTSRLDYVEGLAEADRDD